MDVAQLAVDDVLLGEHRADADALAVQREIAMDRIGGHPVHDLARDLGADAELGVKRGEHELIEGPAAALDDRGARIVENGWVVGRRDLDRDRLAGGAAIGIGDAERDRRLRRAIATLDIRGDEAEAVEPGIRLGQCAGEAPAATDRAAEPAAVHQGTDGRIGERRGDRDVACGRAGELPGRKRRAVGAGKVEAAWLGHHELRSATDGRRCGASRWSQAASASALKGVSAVTVPSVTSSVQSPPRLAMPVASLEAATSAPVSRDRLLSSASPEGRLATSHPQIMMSASAPRAALQLATSLAAWKRLAASMRVLPRVKVPASPWPTK